MANSVMELLDMLYEMIDDAKGGLGGLCKIERIKRWIFWTKCAVGFRLRSAKPGN